MLENIESLPDEMILHVFQYLDQKDLFSIRRVNSRFRRLFFDSSLYFLNVYDLFLFGFDSEKIFYRMCANSLWNLRQSVSLLVSERKGFLILWELGYTIALEKQRWENLDELVRYGVTDASVNFFEVRKSLKKMTHESRQIAYQKLKEHFGLSFKIVD